MAATTRSSGLALLTVSNPFLLDLRSLALFRVGAALLILVDLLIRFQDLHFYTPDGVCPIEAMPHSHWTMKHLELYRWVSQAAGAGGVLGLSLLAALAALSLGVGFFSRTSAALSWYLLASIQNRNIYLNDGGDLLLRIILLICVFLPVGARWSWDARRNPHWKGLSNRYFSLATVAYVVQVCTMYWMAGWLKHDESWRVTGDALYLALSIDQFSTGFAQHLLAYPGLLRVLNFLTLALELCASLFLLCPFWQPGLRLLGVVLLMAFHLGVASCLHLGLFMPICLLVLVGLIPGLVWDRLGWGLPRAPHPESAVEDGALPSGYRLSRPARAFLVSAVAFVVIQNAYTVPDARMVAGGDELRYILGYGRATGLMQNWTLFAPHPLKEDGWFVVQAEFADGSTVDVLTGKPPSYQKPARVSAQFPNQRWRRHFQNLWMRYNPRHVPLYLRWEQQRWNRQNPSRPLTRLKLIFVRELTELPGLPERSQPVILGEYPSRWLPESMVEPDSL